MEPLSNIDRVVAILRQRLQTRAGHNPTKTAQGGPLKAEGMRALLATNGVDERQLRRAVVQDILAEQFGRHLVNDARLQQVIDQVTEALHQSPEAELLLQRVTKELTRAAR